MKKLSLLLFVLFLGQMIHAQELESEIGFLYTKAKYLLETNRAEDAVEVLTMVIKEDAHYKDAMALRAQGRFKLGKTQKAKKDVIKYIEENGLTPDAVKILALINYEEKDFDAAINSLSTASTLFPRDVKIHLKKAEVLQKSGQLSKACRAWHDAAKLGSAKARRLMSKNCSSHNDHYTDNDDDIVYENETDEYDSSGPIYDDTNTEGSDVNQDNDEYGNESNEEDSTINNEENESEVIVEEVETYDITDINLEEGKDKWLKLDDELSVNILGGNLGNRKITQMPNILLLTDETGKIAFDLCVSKKGEVLVVKHNASASTMIHKNNMDYLLRKTKDLNFDYASKTKCGRIIYNINL